MISFDIWKQLIVATLHFVWTRLKPRLSSIILKPTRDLLDHTIYSMIDGEIIWVLFWKPLSVRDPFLIKFKRL